MRWLSFQKVSVDLCTAAPIFRGWEWLVTHGLMRLARGQFSILTWSQVTRHMAFLSPPPDNEISPQAPPESCLGSWSSLGTGSGTASVQAPAGASLWTQTPLLSLPLPVTCARLPGIQPHRGLWRGSVRAGVLLGPVDMGGTVPGC